MIGTGWDAVLFLKTPNAPTANTNGALEGFLNQLPKVSGAWGSGRLLTGTIFPALLTDDGRPPAAVPGQRLTTVAADPAARLK